MNLLPPPPTEADNDSSKITPPRALTSLKSAHPSLASQYHPTLNTKRSSAIQHDSKLPLHWKCPLGPDHDFVSTIAERLKDPSCPCCEGRKFSITNSVAALRPGFAKMFDPDRNDANIVPEKLTLMSRKKVWVKCDLCRASGQEDKYSDHVWQVLVCDAVSNPSLLLCPCCEGLKVSMSNSFEGVRPDIASMFHPSLNGDLKPGGILANAKAKIWLLEGDRSWEVVLGDVVKEEGLPKPPPLPPPPQPPTPEKVIETELETPPKKSPITPAPSPPQFPPPPSPLSTETLPSTSGAKKSMMKRFSGVLSSMMRRRSSAT